MFEGRDRAAYALQFFLVTIGHQDTGLVARLRDHPTPWIDDERPAMARTIRAVMAALRWREYECLGFDRPGTQEDLPVVFSGLPGEGTRHDYPARVPIHQRSIELGKSQVVTDRHADHAKGSRAAGNMVSGREMGGLPVAVRAVGPERDVEEMDLAVARHLATFR
jgi:hypothetical protein